MPLSLLLRAALASRGGSVVTKPRTFATKETVVSDEAHGVRWTFHLTLMGAWAFRVRPILASKSTLEERAIERNRPLWPNAPL